MKKNEINPEWDGSWHGRKDLRVVLIGPDDEDIFPSVPLTNVRLQDGDAMADNSTFENVTLGLKIYGMCIRPALPGEADSSQGNNSALLDWKARGHRKVLRRADNRPRHSDQDATVDDGGG